MWKSQRRSIFTTRSYITTTTIIHLQELKAASSKCNIAEQKKTNHHWDHRSRSLDQTKSMISSSHQHKIDSLQESQHLDETLFSVFLSVGHHKTLQTDLFSVRRESRVHRAIAQTINIKDTLHRCKSTLDRCFSILAKAHRKCTKMWTILETIFRHNCMNQETAFLNARYTLAVETIEWFKK